MKLYSVNAGNFKLDGGAMFGVVPKSIWNRTNPADENNMCSWSMRCLLIEDERRLILIDNGMGNKQDPKFFGHYYLHGDYSLEKSLAAHGFTSDDITDVFLTHLHFDHCGGSIKKIGDSFIPAFKNAIYWSNVAHWEWATMPNEREKASFLKENILPIKTSGQLQFTSVPTSHFTSSNLLHTSTFTKDILIRYVNGHTEKMMLPQINYKGQTIVFMADLLPSVGHLPIPYVMSYDMFPLTTLMEKKSFLQEALEKQYILFFEHDAVHECVRLIQTEKGIRAGEAFTLADL
jgi:glyoxylase-like metal-dependent hydrolase (beta-lactamase superfamily II)